MLMDVAKQEGPLLEIMGFIELFLRWAIPDLFFYIFVFSIFNLQLVDTTLPMLGFKPRISGVGSDCSTN